jgi:hypothetical protein
VGDYDQIVKEWTERTPTSGWSPWEIWNLPLVGPMWVRYRTVDVTDYVRTLHHRETRESNPCPADYWETGNGYCELMDSLDPKDPPMGGPKGRADRIWVGMHITNVSNTYSEDVVGEWSEFEWDHRVFSKLGKRPKFKRSSRYALVEEPIHADRGRLGAGAAGDVASGGPGSGGGKDVITLPALLETDRLSFGDSRAKLSVVVDGVEMRPGQRLEGHKLGRGFHVVDLEGEIQGFGAGRLQLLLNVVSPVEMRAKPITDVEISDEADEGIVEVLLSNRGSSTHGVRVEIDSVPPGWMAANLDEAFFVLAPGQEAVIPVRVKRMFVTDEAREPAAFAVRASLAGTRASDVVTTFLARPRGRRPRKKIVEGLPAILAAPESIAPSRRSKAAKKSRRARATKSRT